MLSNTKILKTEISNRTYDRKYVVWGLFIHQEFDISNLTKFVLFGDGTVPAKLPTQWIQMFVSESKQDAENYAKTNTNYLSSKISA